MAALFDGLRAEAVRERRSLLEVSTGVGIAFFNSARHVGRQHLLDPYGEDLEARSGTRASAPTPPASPGPTAPRSRVTSTRSGRRLTERGIEKLRGAAGEGSRAAALRRGLRPRPRRPRGGGDPVLRGGARRSGCPIRSGAARSSASGSSYRNVLRHADAIALLSRRRRRVPGRRRAQGLPRARALERRPGTGSVRHARRASPSRRLDLDGYERAARFYLEHLD